MMRVFIVVNLFLVSGFALSGCAILRYGDFFLPAWRLDQPTGMALPAEDEARAAQALKSFAEMTPADRIRFPTPYHVYVDTPAPGSFEGDSLVGVAFSGGGTRGTLFAAYCLEALWEYGDITIARPQGDARLDLWAEVDYVSGVSTGAIPAAAFALNYGEHCPEHLRFEQWPECFNVNLISRALLGLGARPDRLARDMTFGMNTRPGLSATYSEVFFEGSLHRVGSGLTFGDLPARPVLLLGSTVIQDPGAEFVQTRSAYRLALGQEPRTPWAVTVQSFESFHTDPMRYSLAEAAYNSISFPGNMRSGLLRVEPERPWVFEGLDGEVLEAMRHARCQPGFEGVYELKDGGLIDNRGILPIVRLFQRIDPQPVQRPLVLAFDAGYRNLREAEQGGGHVKKGWFQELHGSVRVGWQSGQEVYEQLFGEYERQGQFELVRFRFTAFAECVDQPASAEYRVLSALCAEAEEVRSIEQLLAILRGIGTNIDSLSRKEAAAVRVAARFAVSLSAQDLLDWAGAEGAKTAWEHPDLE